MTTTQQRGRDGILAELFARCWEAKRMAYVDPRYKGKHDDINGLLDELGY